MKTWKKIVAAAGAAGLALGLAACGGSDSAGGDTKLIVGASPDPHAKILRYVADNLAEKQGIELEVKEYTDYVQPNEALNSGDLDANYYQTVPYFDDQTAKNKWQFEHGKGIHLEPLGIYSEKLKDIKELKDGAKIGIINDPTNQARALKLLADNGLIKLPKDEKQQKVSVIAKSKEYNPRGFELPEVEGPQLVRALADLDIAVINGNFAQLGGKKPSEALILESTKNNPALNILVWKKDSEKTEAIKKLDTLLHSPEVKAFIEKEWADKAVLPGF
ncbi:MetQ/NlpA family ABC transporter substrate-binding protein [Varibaculum cambriense]|uniref:MetQ/NlpA family ABC transporter substrate-binding protein n=1 Tax=Varibaculum cambriense TaxID=184870 RepID=UPI00290D19D6|nr:MetQ/NlpA family ABC transporter substrate-binding protein [Varibaculum cambriense]MDU5542571.1 MetQ/NlpA family ABC transporter substrate-binding protein [Varibaculum cambriense]